MHRTKPWAEALEHRAERHAALGDPVRLAIADELTTSDRSPVELRQRLHIESNLLAHHLDVLERVGLVERTRSSGDRRRRYVHLLRDSFAELAPKAVGRAATDPPGRALFVCTANSARSQLAAALWCRATGEPAESAGTHPADRVHPRAVAAGLRAGLDLASATPQALTEVDALPPLVITVCDQAHEELDVSDAWLHWSIPDPVAVGTRSAFDAAVVELDHRIRTLVGPDLVSP